MTIDFNLQLEVSEDEMIRFFRAKGIQVKEVESKMYENTYHNQTREVITNIWVVVNPHNREEYPMEAKYKELIGAQAKRTIIDSMDKFFVYASFENN